MAKIPGSVGLTGFIAPKDSADSYAVTDDKYNRGGYKTVADITERDAITADRRKEGMVVYARSDGKENRLVGGTNNSNWSEVVDNAGVSFTDSNATPEDIGGIPAGSTFNNVPVEDLWRQLLYPYQNPSFTTFYVNGANNREVGAYLNGDTSADNNFDFRWTTSYSSNVASNSIQITGDGNTYVSGGDNDGQEVVTDTDIQKTTATTVVFTIQGTNTNSENFTRNATYSWRWKVYWGHSSKTSLTEADIKSDLTSTSLLTDYAGTRNYPAGDYKYFAIPTSFAQPTSFIDADTNFSVAMESPTTVSVTNSYGVTTDYNVYRTTNASAGELNMTITI